MFRLTAVLAAALAAILPGCFVVPENAAPTTSIDVALASQFNFRGQVNSDEEVLQSQLLAKLPSKRGGNIALRAWSNMELHNDLGDSWFPDGHGGEFSQYDLSAAYGEEIAGFDATMGVISYGLQNGRDFPLATMRGETKELFVQVARLTVFELYPALQLHYDFEEVDDWYVSGGISRDIPINGQWRAKVAGSVAYSSDDASDWTYGLQESGWADLQGSGTVFYDHDEHTTLRLSVNGSTILDDDLGDWFDVIGIDEDNVWVVLGVNWVY